MNFIDKDFNIIETDEPVYVWHHDPRYNEPLNTSIRRNQKKRTPSEILKPSPENIGLGEIGIVQDANENDFNIKPLTKTILIEKLKDYSKVKTSGYLIGLISYKEGKAHHYAIINSNYNTSLSDDYKEHYAEYIVKNDLYFSFIEHMTNYIDNVDSTSEHSTSIPPSKAYYY